MPPKFVEQSKSPVDKIVSTEEELRLSCQIQSHVYPKAVVTWYKYGRFGKLKIQEGELLSKTELDMEADSGTYMCQASNHPNGSTLRKIFFVKVYGETKIIQFALCMGNIEFYIFFRTSSLCCLSF